MQTLRCPYCKRAGYCLVAFFLYIALIDKRHRDSRYIEHFGVFRIHSRLMVEARLLPANTRKGSRYIDMHAKACTIGYQSYLLLEVA
jgi:hypothetical protein